MTDRRRTGAGQDRRPVPRDLPDQQAHQGRDRWDAAGPDAAGPDDGRRDAEFPDTDESGTGRRGAARSAGVHPGHPVPDEPSA